MTVDALLSPQESDKNWYLYLDQKVQGPFAFDAVIDLFAKSQVSLLDFGWTKGLTRWKRLLEYSDFAHLLSAYPQDPHPEDNLLASHYFDYQAEENVRSMPRVKVSGNVEIAFCGTFDLINLSLSGVSFFCNEKIFSLDQKVTGVIKAVHLECPVSFSGIVVREVLDEAFQGFGLRFMEMSERDFQFLQSCLSLYLSIIL